MPEHGVDDDDDDDGDDDDGGGGGGDDDDDDDDDVEHLAVSSGWSDSCSGKQEGRLSKCTFN